MEKRAIHIYKFPICFFLLFLAEVLFGQVQESKPGYKTVIAGPQYDRSSLHQTFWGRHYRKEWNTPVSLPVFMLDTAAGGLTPYESGGGMQSKSLRLRDATSREYVLRSIDKRFGRALPEIYKGTFVEKIINDQVSIAHPYSVVTVAPLAEAAKIYHTWPAIVYLPQQNRLDSFSSKYADEAYLFEQRPDGNWEDAANFGNSKNIISTEAILEKMRSDASVRVDQRLYIRSRLFDMFIGDWGRHEDQWRWAEVAVDGKKIYQPIPRDRDQTYTKFDGFLLTLAKSAAGLGHLQSFDYDIKDVASFNFPARNLDRQMANETIKEEWINTAKNLQGLLTDSIIEASVKQLPPEVFPISGNEIINKLKSRRDKLHGYAEDYYSFLAEEVEVLGTKEDDRFSINTTDKGDVELKISATSNDSTYYSRIFISNQTKEIRVFGLGGQDIYDVKGNYSGIIIRIIGGPDDDTYQLTHASNVHIYDNKEEKIERAAGVQIHLYADSTGNRYEYDGFRYDKKGISPSVFYSREDRLYAGLSYKATNYRWRKKPFASKHELFARYSFNQSAFNVGYEGQVNQFIGKWNLLLNGTYDWVRWTNFFGLGNETKQVTDDRDFYRIRSQDGLGYIGLQRPIGKQSSIAFTPFYETIKLLRDTGRFLVKNFITGNGGQNFIRKHFTGVGVDLDLKRWNDQVLPTKGINLFTSVRRTYNIRDEKSFTNYSGNLQFFLPIAKWLVLSVNNGAATVQGEPEFYQLNSIGGIKLRGYRRERFWGQTVFYNNNDLQFIFNVKSKLFNGKAGFVTFADQGRVWLKGEDSDKWHYGYGAGIILVPFNKTYISVQYGISEDDKVIHLNFRRQLKN